MVHPWHEIPLGDDFPDLFRMVVEVPRKGTAKYVLNPELGILALPRPERRFPKALIASLHRNAVIAGK